MLNSQTILFFIFIFDGLIIGVIFDFFRILRRSFKTGLLITSIEDIFFWIIACSIMLYSAFVYNNGIIRGYMFLGVIIGTIFYMLTFSSIIIKICVFVVKNTIRLLIKLIKILYIPIKVILKPLNIIFKKINMYFVKFGKKTKAKEGFFYKM